MGDNRPKVGVWVVVIKDNKILLGKRKNAHWNWTWSFPWGYLEYNESWEWCAIRETMEETWISIKNLRLGIVTNDIFETENKHYVTIFMISDFNEGVVKNMEPEKCEKWEWFNWNELPSPLFLPIQNLLKQNFNLLDLF